MCMKIHNEFGNILTEKQYENILVDSLRKQWLSVKQQVPMDVIFEWKKYWTRFIDIVVDDCVVLELKTLHTEYELKKWYKQTRSYLTLWNYYSGLLIDFGWEKLRYHRLNNPEYMSSSISSQLSSDISYHLLKWVDASKDQSYFLSQLNQEQLSKAIFPLWGMNKSEVRLLAHQIWLPNADRPDSQGLCFVGKVKMWDFLAEKLWSKPWDIVDLQWTVVWHHEWAYRYTIGQRRWLYLPFQAYVSDVNVLDNVVTVARVGEEDILLTDRIIIHNPHWISGEAPQLWDYQCKIRYRQEGQGCKLKRLNDFVGWRGWMTSSAEQRQIPAKGKDAEYVIEFDESIKWVANGQIVVIYDGDEVVGSGVIKKIVGD
jgi:GxxExxY protein